MASNVGGPSSESLNASLPQQPRRRDKAPGGAGRDASLGAGLEAGCFVKDGFATGAGTEILGKPIPGVGSPPWVEPIHKSAPGAPVADTFGAGSTHEIKNG